MNPGDDFYEADESLSQIERAFAQGKVEVTRRPGNVKVARRPGDSKFELYRSGHGFRWRLKTGNGEIIATSGQSYDTKDAAKHSIEKMLAEASKARFAAS